MLRRLGYILFVAALSGGVGFAQSTLGTILGTVTDPSGGVIAGAKVKILNVDDGTSRDLTTDATGNYDAVDVKAGHYSVEVSLKGFKTTRVDSLELGSRATLRVNVSLNVGSINQELEVTWENVGVITMETETVSSTFNSLEITNLPINY